MALNRPIELNQSELRSLLAQQEAPCVSIYMPTYEAGREVQQNPIRFKNQIAEARDKLTATYLAEADSDSLLKGAEALLEDNDFWQHQQQGLAVFISPEGLRYYRAEQSFDPFMVVSPQFYISPLLPAFSEASLFYILAASQNKVGLYQATRNSVKALDLGDTPLSLEVALRYDDPSESLQGHSSDRATAKNGGQSGSRQTVFHGQGGGKDTENSDILRFFHLVSEGVESAIHRHSGSRHIPLVFVGLDFLFPLYSSTNKYPHLLESAVDTQPDQLSAEEIRDHALEVVTPHFNASRQSSLENYGSLETQKLATADLSTVLSAAHDGQVDTLFVAKDAQMWGSFDAKARRASTQAQRSEDDQDLLNLAAALALNTDATVYALDESEIPGDGAIAATLRYPVVEAALVSA